jgi:Dolichyl-phosphate-mannose-protein mannosyltransferase
MALGLALRLLYFSGFGLGDDILFRHFINNILQNRTIPPDSFSYRATWWFPTALAARLLGLDEPALALPITAAATLGIGVVYLLGKLLFGRPGGVIAALLLIFQPLDFAWSTMLANDILGSLFSALCFLFVLLALEPVSAVARRRRWILAAVSLWLSYHAKVTAVILLTARHPAGGSEPDHRNAADAPRRGDRRPTAAHPGVLRLRSRHRVVAERLQRRDDGATMVDQAARSAVAGVAPRWHPDLPGQASLAARHGLG